MNSDPLKKLMKLNCLGILCARSYPGGILRLHARVFFRAVFRAFSYVMDISTQVTCCILQLACF
jgi:hypothetical protein